MFARTKRLFLRPAWPEDAEALLAGMGHKEIVDNLGTAPWPFGIEDARARIARDKDTPAHEASCLVFLRTGGDPELVGGIGFGRWNDRVPYPELGYWITRSHWGIGIAYEAGYAALEMAFLGVGYPVIAAGHYVDNPASGRVLTKLGFEPTGEILPYPCVARGCDVDSVEYALTRTRWLEVSGVYREAA